MSNQAIQFNGHLTRIGTRSDGSLGLTLETPEFTSEECLAVFSLRNIPCEVTLRPNDADAMPPKEIKGEFDKLTQSQRIRRILYVWYRELGEPGQFDAFYQSETNKYIESIKAKLPEKQQTPF